MNFKLCRSEKSRKVPLQQQFITDQISDHAMNSGTVDLQTTQGLQKTAAEKARNQASEKARFFKFQPDGLKPSEILGQENVQVRNNNYFALAKIHHQIPLSRGG
ncbi:hypothetical protein AVEN_183659-1 [Araneus ventricosus]|uniref:Uncharacterized protein n=1 Tax=Araneus ventricosus TaxID=182803 RepID=A0A4Y2WDR3_ARAVE|nr:hypothetical protein AVEN_183659-1 [Araneus ventricosus]